MLRFFHSLSEIDTITYVSWYLYVYVTECTPWLKPKQDIIIRYFFVYLLLGKNKDWVNSVSFFLTATYTQKMTPGANVLGLMVFSVVFGVVLTQVISVVLNWPSICHSFWPPLSDDAFPSRGISCFLFLILQVAERHAKSHIMVDFFKGFNAAVFKVVRTYLRGTLTDWLTDF